MKTHTTCILNAWPVVPAYLAFHPRGSRDAVAPRAPGLPGPSQRPTAASFRHRRKLRVTDRHQSGIPRGSRNAALYRAALHSDRALWSFAVHYYDGYLPLVGSTNKIIPFVTRLKDRPASATVRRLNQLGRDRSPSGQTGGSRRDSSMKMFPAWNVARVTIDSSDCRHNRTIFIKIVRVICHWTSTRWHVSREEQQ